MIALLALTAGAMGAPGPGAVKAPRALAQAGTPDQPAPMQAPGEQPPTEPAAIPLIPASPATSRVLGAVGLPDLAALLEKAGYESRVVTTEQLDMGAVDSYGLLLVNLERPLTVTSAAFLSDFVARGGRLIACSWGPAVSPRRQAAFPAYRLQDLLQFKVTGWSSDGNAYLRAGEGTPLFRGLPRYLDVRVRATPLLDPLGGARVDAQWVSEESGSSGRPDSRSPAIIVGPRCAYFAPNVLSEALRSRQMLRLLANTIGTLLPAAGADPGRLALAELEVALTEARRVAGTCPDPESTILLGAAEQKASAAIQLAAQPATPPAAALTANGTAAATPATDGAQAPGPVPAPAQDGAAPATRALGQPAAPDAGGATPDQPGTEGVGPAPAAGLAPIPPSAFPVIAEAIDAAERVILLQVPCRDRELRGVLLPRSVIPPSRVAIARMLDGLRTAGINAVFADVYSAGQTLAPGPDQDPRFAGHDPLASLAAEATPRGIAVHAWISLLTAGPPSMKGGILASHSRWAAQTRGGSRFVARGQQWLCPSQADVREAICDGIRRALVNAPIQGILLDGLDYGGTAEACYDPVCVSLFRADTGRNPREGLRGEWEQEWLRWRRDRLNVLMRRVTRELRSARPGLPLHVAILQETADPRITSLPDWRMWVRSRWVDGICPHSDTAVPATARKTTERALRLAPDARVMPVIDAARVRTARHAMSIVGAVQEGSAAGVLFDVPSPVADAWCADLGRGCFRRPAALPW